MTDELLSLRAILLSGSQNDHDMFRQAAATAQFPAGGRAPAASHVTIPQELAWRLFTKSFDREFARTDPRSKEIAISEKGCFNSPLWLAGAS